MPTYRTRSESSLYLVEEDPDRRTLAYMQGLTSDTDPFDSSEEDNEDE
jgi:hypothetical protein